MAQQDYPRQYFEFVEVNPDRYEKMTSTTLTFWEDVWSRFKKNKLAVTGVILLILLAVMAILGPVITPYSYEEMKLSYANQPPSADHWFGTDDLGRDVFTRVWIGARISLFIGVAAAVIDLVIGVIWGGISGYFGGRIDEIMMRIADILIAVPYLLLVILLMVIMEPGLATMIIAMSITGWINMARIVRGNVMKLKNQEFVMAARTLGASVPRILMKHLIPNTMGVILVTMTLTIPQAIFTEAFLSYLGLGVPAPLASWGTMASEGLPALEYYPWRLIFPALFITLTIFSFNVIGDGLRDALDPRLRK